ncbi:MAG: copper transporter [Actinomycetota bacterium]|nr:copper transporter [Actinomycetota bacterium]
MINLRYHIVSLVAVFLALGLGILVGTTVIDQGLVHDLRRRTDGFAKNLDDARATNDALSRQQALWEAFGRDAFARFGHGKLSKRSIVFVVQDGTSPGMLDGIVQSLGDAGAVIEGRVNLTGKWELKSDEARQQLALALGSSASSSEDLITEAAGRLAGRLGQSRNPAGGPDLLVKLRDAGFLSFESTVESFPSSSSLTVVVPSGVKDAKPPQSQFFMPFLVALAPARKTAIVEPLSAAESLVDRVRGSSDLRDQISTVDDGDIALGRFALVYALRSLVVTNTSSHYGARRSAAKLVPDLFAA